MINTLFGDSIVNATELRKNQKEWLERAYRAPITVNYGHKQLAIMNREQVSKLYIANRYAEMVIKASKEFREDKENTVFPWVENLQDGDKFKFFDELLNCTLKTLVTGDWDELDILVGDWRATAEVERDSKLAEALLEKGDPSQYVEIKD